MASPEKDGWWTAMVVEMASLWVNQVYKLIKRPPNCRPIATRWVYGKKMNVEGMLEKFKARVVTKGFRQVP